MARNLATVTSVCLTIAIACCVHSVASRKEGGHNSNVRPTVRFRVAPAASTAAPPATRNGSLAGRERGSPSALPYKDPRSAGAGKNALPHFPFSPDAPESPRSSHRFDPKNPRGPYAPKPAKKEEDAEPKAEPHHRRKPSPEDDYYDYDDYDYDYEDYEDYRDAPPPPKKKFHSFPAHKKPAGSLVTKARLPATYRTKPAIYTKPANAYAKHPKHPKHPPRVNHRPRQYSRSNPRRKSSPNLAINRYQQVPSRRSQSNRRPGPLHRSRRPVLTSSYGVEHFSNGQAFSGARRKPVFADVHEIDSYDNEDYYYDDYYADRPTKRQGYGYGSGGGGGGGGGGIINPLALVVAPLAGIALLTAAAGVALNPVLVSISLTQGRRRRKRGVRGTEEAMGNGNATSSLPPDVEAKVHEIEVLERYLGSVPSQLKYQQQILSMYLGCSGYTEEANKCLDRVVCEYSNKNSKLQDEERDVVAIVLYNIMANEFVSDDYKARLRRSARVGRDDDDEKTCGAAFVCGQLDGQAPDHHDQTFDDMQF